MAGGLFRENATGIPHVPSRVILHRNSHFVKSEVNEGHVIMFTSPKQARHAAPFEGGFAEGIPAIALVDNLGPLC